MKKLENSQLANISGGLDRDACAAIAVASYLFASSGFFAGALFGAAVYLGAGCASVV